MFSSRDECNVNLAVMLEHESSDDFEKGNKKFLYTNSFYNLSWQNIIVLSNCNQKKVHVEGQIATSDDPPTLVLVFCAPSCHQSSSVWHGLMMTMTSKLNDSDKSHNQTMIKALLDEANIQ